MDECSLIRSYFTFPLQNTGILFAFTVSKPIKTIKSVQIKEFVSILYVYFMATLVSAVESPSFPESPPPNDCSVVR